MDLACIPWIQRLEGRSCDYGEMAPYRLQYHSGLADVRDELYTLFGEFSDRGVMFKGEFLEVM